MAFEQHGDRVATHTSMNAVGVQCGVALQPYVTRTDGTRELLLPSRYTLQVRARDLTGSDEVGVATNADGWQLRAGSGLSVDYDVVDNANGAIVVRDHATLACGDTALDPAPIAEVSRPTRDDTATRAAPPGDAQGSASGWLAAEGPLTGTWRLDVAACSGLDQQTEWSADDLFYQTVLVGNDGRRVAVRFDLADRELPARISLEDLSDPNGRWATFQAQGGMIGQNASDDRYRCETVAGDVATSDFKSSGRVRVMCSSPSGSSLRGSFVFKNCPDDK